MSFMLPSLPVIKLGYSNDPQGRLKGLQRKPLKTRGTVDRHIDIKTGHTAICLEKAMHRHMKIHRPELIVDRDHFCKHLRTKSEIYHACGRDFISGLLDAIDAGWDPNLSDDWAQFCVSRKTG